MQSNKPPSDSVLAAFGVRVSTARPLDGGEGRTWSAGPLVLKPVDNEVEATWVAEVLSGLTEDGFRINRPVRSREDLWVVDGWSAWVALVGEHDTSNRWTEVLGVGQRLNTALRGLERPAFLDSKANAWSVADRMAWNQVPLAVIHDQLWPLAERLAAHLVPDDSPSQVIHGDLTANVLFAPGLAPAVIDFTPYWRPARFCLAVVVVDALLWHAAPACLIDATPDTGDRASLLARAALYRLIASDRLALDKEPGTQDDYLRAAVVDHERVLTLLDRSDPVSPN